VLVSQKVSLRLSILLGSESGAAAYTETRQTITNPQGIFAVVVGDNIALTKSSNFSEINWGTASKFIKVEMDPNAGTNFTVMGTSKLQPVPFAFYAYGVDAENVDGILPLGSGGTGVASIAALKTSLGVDQINNTADASKPISTATQDALNTKVDKVSGKELSTNDYSTAEKTKLAAITGSNTGDQDLSAFASTEQLASKANTSDVISSLATKVDKEIGKGLSSNDYTTAEKTKLAAISGNVAGPQGPTGSTGPAGATGPAGIAGLLTSGNAAGNTPYWNGSQWVVNSSNLFNNGANLGIGTPTPSEKLDVVGNVKASGTVTSGAITYPNTAGTNGQVLTSNGSGTASWTTAAAAGVPYTGATQAVNLGEYDLTVNSIKIGTGPGTSTTTSLYNTVVGLNALVTNSTGTRNTAVGRGASKSNTTGSENTATGYGALNLNTTGNNNTASGSGALFNSTTGSSNTATGFNVLGANTIGSENTATGTEALVFNTSGSYNSSFGKFALKNNTTGLNNTAVGINALNTNTTGFSNTAIGSNANVSSANLSNATALGNQAIVTASNTIQLGNTDVTNVKTSGTITAGTVTYPNTHGSANQILSTTGSGTLAWTTPAAGLPTSGNTAGDMLYWNGSAWVKVPAGSNGQSLSFQNGAPTWKGTFSYRNTVKTATGKIWMDRNLGAAQVATSATDVLAYGDLYQWGRGSDGHESRLAGEINVASTSDTPGHGDFINQSSNRWRDPTNLNLWQGVNGINNPCPAGFRLPTKAEWEAEIATWTGSGFDSPLKLPLGGHQHPTLSTPWQVGGSGSYWSSTPNDGLHSWNLGLGSTTKTMGIAQQGHGFSVRCIKDY
jgi:hypothetical protein